MEMDLKTKIEILPCCKCEDMIDCETCYLQKEAQELYKQIRAEVIEEIEKELLSHGFIFTEHALEVWHGIAKQLKERNK